MSSAYFVAPKSQRLIQQLAGGLQAARLKSWLGDTDDDCSWMAGRLGDVFPHETFIRHIRGGLEERFPCWHPGETPAQFARRMAKVQEFLNSDEFAAPSGGGLATLARSLRARCNRLLDQNGGRLQT